MANQQSCRRDPSRQRSRPGVRPSPSGRSRPRRSQASRSWPSVSGAGATPPTSVASATG